MKKSFTASATFHVALLVGAIGFLPGPKPFDIPPVQAIQVDISKIGDHAKIKTTTTEESENKKNAPKKKAVVEKVKPAEKVADKVNEAVREKSAPEPEKKPEIKETIKEEPKKEIVKKVEPKKVEDKPLDSDPLKQLMEEQQKEEQVALLAEKKKVEDEKKKEAAEVRKKAEADKKKLAEVEKKKAEDDKKKADAKKAEDDKKKSAADAKKKKDAFNDIAEFLNKTEGENTAPQESSDVDGSPEKAENAVKGDDSEMIGTLQSLIKQKLASCWTKPPAALGSGIKIRVSWQMKKDGNVIGQPVPVGSPADELERVTMQSAVSAILECAPFNELPVDRHDLWKEIVWEFEP